MSKAWDILPPRPRPKTQIKRKKSSKNGSLFFVILFIIFGAVLISFLNQNEPEKINGAATTSPQTPAAEISSAPIPKTQDKLKVKLLNGSGQSEQTAEIKKMLENAGFKVSKTEDALNLYDQTIIYFEETEKEFAQEMAETLQKYEPKLQKFSQTSSYDLIVVIGVR